MNERDYSDFIDSQYDEEEQRQRDDEMSEYWRPFVDDDLAFLLETE